MKERLKELVKLNQKQKGSKEKVFYFILDQLRKHIDEVKALKINNNPHVFKEIADMVLLTNMLSINEDVSDDVFEERIGKIGQKIKNENQ